VVGEPSAKNSLKKVVPLDEFSGPFSVRIFGFLIAEFSEVVTEEGNLEH
jgi:hypothetical protein